MSKMSKREWKMRKREWKIKFENSENSDNITTLKHNIIHRLCPLFYLELNFRDFQSMLKVLDLIEIIT